MKKTVLVLAAIILPFAVFSASYTNSFVRNGVTYVQRGGLTIKDYVITNIDENAIGSSMTTNDVKNIVTNETLVSYVADIPYNSGWEVSQDSAKFTITDFYWEGDTVHYMCNGTLYVTNSFPSYLKMATDRDVYLYVMSDHPITVGSTPDEWILEIGTKGGFDGYPSNYFKPYTVNSLGLARLIDLPPLTNNLHVASMTTNEVCAIVTNGVDINAYSEWTITSSSQYPIYLIFYNGQWSPVDIPDNPNALVGDPKGDANSTNLVWTNGSDATFDITATRTVTSSYRKNSLGIAGETGAVSEILIIGSDNKLYHLRIGSGGSIDVYMEAN